MIAKVNPQEILADIMENIESDIDGLEEKILITTSCKASVKAGQKLSTWQMQEIVKNGVQQKCLTHARTDVQLSSFPAQGNSRIFQRNA